VVDARHDGVDVAAADVIPHSRPSVRPADAEAVALVVATGQISQAGQVERLELRWREVTGAAAAVCVASGTGALRLALHALGVGPGDEVVVPAYSCVALLNAPLALGAAPVLADVEPGEWTLSPADVATRIGRRTKAIVPVHLFGLPAPMAELRDFGLPLVEDCAHAVGGTTDAGPMGGSEIAFSSFNATKLVGAGEGGVVSAQNEDVARAVRAARDNGAEPPSGAHLNEHMSDLEAALAIPQLERLPETLAAREALAARYSELLEPLAARGELELPAAAAGRVWYRYAVRLLRADARDVSARACAGGVMIKRPVAIDAGRWPSWSEALAGASEALRTVVSLPLYPGLSDADLERVVGALETAMG
jgi:perosamine synthetase